MLHTGRHFLQIPGPTNVPDRVLRAMDRPVIDHRGPEFAALTAEVMEGLRPIFQTTGPVVIYPSSGTGAAEAALVNTLSPGDQVILDIGLQYPPSWVFSYANSRFVNQYGDSFSGGTGSGISKKPAAAV